MTENLTTHSVEHTPVGVLIDFWPQVESALSWHGLSVDGEEEALTIPQLAGRWGVDVDTLIEDVLDFVQSTPEVGLVDYPMNLEPHRFRMDREVSDRDPACCSWHGADLDAEEERALGALLGLEGASAAQGVHVEAVHEQAFDW